MTARASTVKGLAQAAARAAARQLDAEAEERLRWCRCDPPSPGRVYLGTRHCAACWKPLA